MEKLNLGTVAMAIVNFTFHAIIGNLTRKSDFTMSLIKDKMMSLIKDKPR
jgi:hypothetical protein